jgi:eukaryotic-like serine/threonine-protein kinase
MLERLIHEIHRRSMWQVLAIFVASGWAVLQVIDALIGNGILPDWVFRAGLVLLLLGLPVVLATAFVQEGLPGSSPEKGSDGEASVGDVVAERAPVNLAAGTGSLDRRSTRAPRHHRLFTWRNAVLGGVGAFALLGVGAGGWMGMRVLGIGPAGTLAAQGVIERGAEVVLADFQSSDDTELGDVVTRTLRIDLRQSPMIRVVERADLAGPLTRMQTEADTRITSDIATQLAEREGYAAVITGDVARAGSGYVLTAGILAGRGFRPAAEFRETARSDDQLIDAIERLSRRIRDKAGESLRTVQGGRSLARVTTSSLPALREYTRGEALQDVGDQNAALEHFERAAALDSTFAMAHRKIAVALSNLRVRRPDAVRAFRRAYELRDRLPDLERELAMAAYASQVLGDVAASTKAYQRALAIDSTNVAVLTNLGVDYLYLGRYADAVRYSEAVIRLRPVSSGYGNLAIVRFREGDLPLALAAVDSGMAAQPGWSGGYFFKAMFTLARQDLAAADSFSRLFHQNATTARDRRRSAELRIALSVLRGKLRAAERVLDEPDILDPIARASYRARLEIMRGDTATGVARVKQALEEHEADDPMFFEAVYTLTLARAGDPASATLAAWNEAVPDDQLGLGGRVSRQGATASTQRAQRDFDGALRTLEDAVKRWPGMGPAANYDIAQTYDEMGNAVLAIEWYERSLDTFDESAMYAAPQVTLALRRLGELYDGQGNTERAIAYYARFVNLWRDADPELQPLVRRAQERLNALRPDRG